MCLEYLFYNFAQIDMIAWPNKGMIYSCKNQSYRLVFINMSFENSF